MATKKIYKPTSSAAVDIPAAVFSGTDNFGAVLSILSDQDYGYFYRPALLVDAMMTDDRILSVSQRRVAAPFNVPLAMKPADDGAKRKRIADLLLPEGGHGGEWHGHYPQETLEQILFWGIWIGVVAVQKLWKYEDKQYVPRLRVWHPQFLRWDWTARRYAVNTLNQGSIILPEPGEVHPEWAVWSPSGEYGWRRGLVRSLAFSYLEKRWGKRDWARYNEVHGLPTRVAVTPQGAPALERRAYFRDVSRLGSDPTIECPQGDKEKAGYDFKLVEAVARTFETFQIHRDTVNKDIAIAMLGENLSTDSGGPTAPGSLGQSQTQAEVSKDRIRKDVKLFPWLRTHFLMPWADSNYGDAELAPIPVAEVDPPEDDVQRTTVLKQLGDAVTSLKAGFGDRIDEDALAERFDVPMRMTKEEWDIIKPPPVLPGGPGDPGANGDGGPGGEDVAASGNGDVAADDADAGTAEEKADKAAMAILSALERTQGHYPDRVAASASVAMAKAMARDRIAILKAIKGAGSPEEVRKALAKRMRAVDSTRAAEVVKRARLMSYLGGMVSAQHEVSK